MTLFFFTVYAFLGGYIIRGLHVQGEEYKLFWPEQPEFVRVASKFGAKIVPFGVVGEDDIFDVRFSLLSSVNLLFSMLARSIVSMYRIEMI